LYCKFIHSYSFSPLTKTSDEILYDLSMDITKLNCHDDPCSIFDFKQNVSTEVELSENSKVIVEGHCLSNTRIAISKPRNVAPLANGDLQDEQLTALVDTRG